MSDSHFILKKYWGYDSFRPLQEDIVQAVLDKKDTLALLPTGGGKSICFQVPAMLMDGLCLVVSPLIALMKDQVENLNRRGIAALAVYSGMTFIEVKKTLQNAAFGHYKFLYVSPERLETKLFLEFLPAIKPNLIAVDEAHCISQWGYDFRPPYLRIANLREHLPGIPVIALTASATPPVQKDICEKLLFNKDHRVFKQSFERPNLSYSVFAPVSKQSKLIEILKNVTGSSIVYCKSRRQTQQVAALLKLQHINADFYHAGLGSQQRAAKQEAWIKNNIRTILCTNAFGMGIDKPDVRVVVHYDVPECLENYYQEAGRAGRDGKRAYAVLLQEQKELDDLLYKVGLKYPPAAEIKTVYTALMNYLQVAAGGGEETSYDFDIARFAQNFKLNILQATYAIQALAQEELISYNEVFFKPSTVEFTISKSDLQEFEEQHPLLEPVIKGLLRTYEGIFDYTCTIYESLLAKFLKISVEDLTAALFELHRYKIITYNPPSDKQQLFLIKNRMYNDDYKFDNKKIDERRKYFEERINTMIAFVKDVKKCRSLIIGNYFGDDKIKNCGICDNCISRRDNALKGEEFNNILKDLLNLLKTTPLKADLLVKQIPGIKQDKLWQVLDFLIAENIIATNEENKFYLL